MKYKAGDPVWALRRAHYVNHHVPSGEHPGIVEGPYNGYLGEAREWYEVFIPAYPCPLSEGGPTWAICETVLRPRRDDYQQHEGLGSRENLTKPAHTNDIIKSDDTREALKEAQESLEESTI